ncbi:vacuolar protein sorting-associated protein 51 homolog [Anthonomus grandis grandis]|uniref:vacuolar protein sorting-associated protein 51 homolog n=1 Tax=Anthonomus grandis grandis TaxID=2921223 RepID=UPI002165A9C1|nr:vacuolar protein sorting-associated protein 51 homolog [Anthonomus grandis grandis]
MAEKNQNALDINGPNFDPNLYLDKVFKECTLRQIMDHENEIVKDTQTLHSDMQTLVYENYNKFISATDTIKKMKNDFKKMEDEMDLLMSNMETITSFSDKINSNLQESRDKISHLSGVHSLLQRLQFLFKLPGTLKSRMEEKNYIQATQDYLHAQRVLQQYGDMPAFQGIKHDCEAILSELKTELRKQFCNANASTKELAESVDLLLQLEEPPTELCMEFLSCAEKRLSEQLVMLKDQSEQRDITEFIDLGSSGFLSDICLIVASFHDMFINRVNTENLDSSEIFENFAAVELESFVKENMKKYFTLVQTKVDSEQEIVDTPTLVRALDHFYLRIDGNRFSKDVNFTEMATEIINRAARKQCKAHLQVLKLGFSDTLTKVKQALATPKLISQEDTSMNLSELLNSMITTVVEKTKGVLQDLVSFIGPEVTFARKSDFRESLCLDNVREGLIVCFLHHLTASVRNITAEGGPNSKMPPTLVLLLSRFCLDFKNSSVHFLLSKTDEIFSVTPKRNSSALTNETEICKAMQESAQFLLNYYVQLQGHNCSQMLRKSVETRDWLHTIEPRTVRAVMKRVVEDISAIDASVALLYEDQGTATGNSSDSSRKTHSISVSRAQYKSNWSSYTPSHLDSTLVSNMHKLFSERIEIFSPVEFSKVSILTGIIKISLKTFMECVRLKTFSKYGLQQIQVDTHYLQLYLWRFVADENLVHFLLDEILGSTVHRCLEPVLMEPSVVDIICERG